LKIGKQIKAGKAGAKIIDRGPEPNLLIVANDVLEMVRLLYFFALGDLENDSLVREAPFLGRRTRRTRTPTL